MGVYLLNSSLPVDIWNATLNVNVTNTPLSVLVQRQAGDLNATVSIGLLNEILGNLTMLKNMADSRRYASDCPATLGTNGASSACRTLTLNSEPQCFCFIDYFKLSYSDAKSFCSSLAPQSSLMSSSSFDSLLLNMARMMTVAGVQGKNFFVDTGSSMSRSTIYSQGGTPSAALTSANCSSVNNFICEFPL